MNSTALKPCPRIAITTGDPASIGPDIVIDLAQQQQQEELVVIADPALLHDRAKQLALPLSIRLFDATQPARALAPGELCVDTVPLNAPVTPGVGDYRNSEYVLASIERAIACCSNNTFDALVTGPINKHLINSYLEQAHAKPVFFSGHTEFLAQQTQTPRVVMMLAAALQPPLRVALATTHLPLREVANAIQPAMLEETLRILNHDLIHHFGIAKPNILVCGLNPHAGEQGDLGNEEITIIQPVIDQLRREGFTLSDPLPADTLFTEKYLAQADAVLAMYHDQGLPVLKSHGFGEAVNITLGLPFIRTSVDHGTAFDLAGSGAANSGSMAAAIAMATQLGAARAH